MNFVFARQQKQIILEGKASPLLQEENQRFWETLPRERQLRFFTYAPVSGQVIKDLGQLEQRKRALSEEFSGNLPMSEWYCGFRFQPDTFIFYTVGQSSFSEVIRYRSIDNSWQMELLSP